MQQYTTGTPKKVIEEKCPICGGYIVILGREMRTDDVFCKCYEKNNTTGGIK